MNTGYRGPRNAEPAGDIPLNFFAFERNNFPNLGLCEFDHVVLFAPSRSPVKNFIGHVFCWSLPRQVLWVHAPAPAVSAGVGGVVRWRQRNAVDSLADNTVNGAHLAAKPHLAVPIVVAVVWPYQAFISLVWENSGPKIILDLAARCITGDFQRIAVLSQTSIVLSAQAFPVVGSVAPIN